MQNYSSGTSALKTHAHLGSHEKSYFNNFGLTYEFITFSSVWTYTAWHYTSDACCLRKLMLHSGNHMGGWQAARRPAEHDPTFVQTFPAQENCLHGLHQAWSRNKGILYVVVAHNHQIPKGLAYANVINERSRTDSRQTLVAGNHMGTRDFVMSREPRGWQRLPCLSMFLLYNSLFQFMLSPVTKFCLQALQRRAFILFVL